MVCYGRDKAARNAFANQFQCRKYTAINEAHLDWTLDEIYFDQSALAVLFLETFTASMERKINMLAQDRNWCLEWHQFAPRALDRTRNLSPIMKAKVIRAYYHTRRYIHHALRKWRGTHRE